MLPTFPHNPHFSAQNDMDALEQIQGMPPGMYHRYGVLDDMDDDEDEPSREDMGDGFGSSGAYNADMLVAGMAGLGVSDAAEGGEQPGGAEEGAGGSEEGGAGRGIGNWSLLAHPGEVLEVCGGGLLLLQYACSHRTCQDGACASATSV
jgi:hypothetical protein